MLKIALRNVFRNRRRTALSLTLIALGAAMLFLVKGYFDYSSWGIRMGQVAQYGHMQIADKRHWAGTSEGYEHLIPQEKLAQIEALLKDERSVKAFTRRLNFSGLIGTEKKSAVFVGVGVEPENPIANPSDLLIEGAPLFKGDQSKALIGVGLAKKLGVRVGDWVTVLGMTTEGAFNAGSLQIVGLFQTGTDADARLGAVPLAFAQRMLYTKSVERIIVELDDLEATEKAAGRLRQALQNKGLADFEIKTWSDLAVHYHKLRAWFDAMFFFVTAAIFVLVLFRSHLKNSF